MYRMLATKRKLYSLSGTHKGARVNKTKEHKVLRQQTTKPSNKKVYAGTLPFINKCKFHHNGQWHYNKDCPELKNRNHGNLAGDTEARGLIRKDEDASLDILGQFAGKFSRHQGIETHTKVIPHSYHPQADKLHQSKRNYSTLKDMPYYLRDKIWKMMKRTLTTVSSDLESEESLTLGTLDHLKILDSISPVAYKLELSEELSNVHNTFHISNLKKCLSDESLVIPMKELQLDDKLNFVKEPIEIMDQEVKKLKQSRIPILKVIEQLMARSGTDLKMAKLLSFKLYIGIRATVIDNKVKTLTITTFLFPSKKVLRATTSVGKIDCNRLNTGSITNSNSYLRDILGKDMYYPLTFVKPIRVSLVYKRNPKAQCYVRKEEYDIWAMEMEHYLEYIDNEVWKVIQNGNSKKRISTGKDGVVRVLSPVTAAEIQAVEKERKAKNILLMAIPKEHMRRFHGMDDAKEIWEAIRTRFGGNANSKKMQKAVFKQQFEAFKISNSEGLEKGYDSFVLLLPLNNILKRKFVVVLMMKTSFPSLPNKIRGFGHLHEDLELIDDGEHTEAEEANHALMAISSSNEKNRHEEAVKGKGKPIAENSRLMKDRFKNLWRLTNLACAQMITGLGFENNLMLRGPQKTQLSVSDDNSSEHSTCQLNDSKGSCKNTSEHSFKTESESLSEPNEMSKSRLEVTNEKDVSAQTQMANFNAVMGRWGSAVKTSASYTWRNSRPNFNYNSGPTSIRTMNANGPQGRPKPGKAWAPKRN
ncbi:hypothetical protein Tco_1576273 [Tanacetum coccineum]